MAFRTLPSTIGLLASACVIGCAASPSGPRSSDPVPPSTQPARRPRVAAAVENAASRPATEPPLGPPYRLDVATIVRLVFERSPDVTAAREDMVSAIHGLEAFRANLSRLEPFAELNSSYSRFPNQQSTRTLTGEATVGIRKETFEGAVFRVEGGGSASRARIGDPAEGEKPIDEGSGGVLRGRVEVPFVGSRKRQDRIINEAYQESNARKARLNYLRDFRLNTLNALSYYNSCVLYRNYADGYARHVADLEKLSKDPRLAEADRSRVRSVITDYESREASYRSYEREYLRHLLARMGLDQNDEVVIEIPEYKESVFIQRASTPEGVAEMIEEARANNPTFRVFENAIKDAELQRRLAIEGKLDITAYVEGTNYPFGGVDYDTRADGWMVAAGVTVSLNDRRVLTATRLKAEADIRAYQARADEELIEIKRQIITETESLRTDRDRRIQLLELIKQKQEEYASRCEAYLTAKKLLIDQVLESRSDLTAAELNLYSLLYSCRAGEIRLQAALGVYYQIAGLNVADVAGEAKK